MQLLFVQKFVRPEKEMLFVVMQLCLCVFLKVQWSASFWAS